MKSPLAVEGAVVVTRTVALLIAPCVSVTVNIAVYVPTALYVCVTMSAVLYVADMPSPKVHL
jgi:hypothetical protein